VTILARGEEIGEAPAPRERRPEEIVRCPQAVVLASAGTGKTYQLTNRYIRLLALGCPPASILATTFTRAAAGEILERVLKRLAAAAEEPAALAELSEAIGVPLTRERCARLLADLAEGLGRVQVLTIDSLFMRLASGFLLEVDAPAGWRIGSEEEDERLRSRALAEAVEAVAEVDRDGLIELLRALGGGTLKRGVASEIRRAVETAYAAAMHALEAHECWRVDRGAYRALGPAELPDALRRAADPSIIARTKAGDPSKSHADAVARILDAVASERWADALDGKFAGQVLDRSASAPVFSRVPIPAACVEAIRPLVEHAICRLLEDFEARNHATRALLAAFHAAYERLKRETGTMRFDDVPRLLAGVARPGGAEPAGGFGLGEMYYRLDARCRHLLLDEFQDTATTQFRLLRPVMDELLSVAGDPDARRKPNPENPTFLCVGDVKQSLYMWREAEPGLLPSLAERWPQIECFPLATSWRSSPVVLDTVNAVFGNLTSNPALAAHADVAEAWHARWNHHRAAKSPPPPGHACLSVYPEPEAGEGEKPSSGEVFWLRVRHAARRVAAIREEAPGATVGVLVRKSRWIAPLIHALRELGVAASEEGGNPLTDAAPVAVACSLLRLADHPGHSAAAFHVARSPFAEAVGLRDHADRTARLDASRRIRRRIAGDGYAGLFAWLLERAGPAMSDAERRRFRRLVDLAEEAADVSMRPGDVADLIEGRKVAEPSAAGVRVMTVHKSKGLEFDAVVLPDLTDKWCERPGSVLVERDGLLGPVKRVTRWPDAAIQAFSPPLAAMVRTAHERAVSEELCVLYVAMTRARRVLEMLVPASEAAPGKTSPHPCASYVLAQALAPDAMPEPGEVLWRAGDRAAALAGFDEAPDAGATEVGSLELRLAPLTDLFPAHRLPKTKPSELEGGDIILASELLKRPDVSEKARSLGTLIHAWFELVGWTDRDPDPTDAQLAAAAAAQGFPEPDPEAITLFRESLGKPAIRAALALAQHGGFEGGVEDPHRERTFAVPVVGADGKRRLLSGQFDRVVAGRTGERIAWIEILDFKTDRVQTEAEIAQRVDHYRPQLEAYRLAARALFRAPEDAPIRCRLLFLRPGTVVEV